MRILATLILSFLLLAGCAGVQERLAWIIPPWFGEETSDQVSGEMPAETAIEIQEDEIGSHHGAAHYELEFPIMAGSWGGKVRAGPGMEYAHVTSLKEGDSVDLIGLTDVEMNGYPWFHIQYRGGSEGYKWGGILCAKDIWVEGLFERCPSHRHLGVDIQVRPDANLSALAQIDRGYKLIPGHWVSSSDPKSILVFDDQRGTFDIYDGVKVTAGSWTLEEYQGSPTKVTLRRTIDDNVDVYSVLFLDSNDLTLSFLPRGNTLSFRRME